MQCSVGNAFPLIWKMNTQGAEVPNPGVGTMSRVQELTSFLTACLQQRIALVRSSQSKEARLCREQSAFFEECIVAATLTRDSDSQEENPSQRDSGERSQRYSAACTNSCRQPGSMQA